MTQHLPTIAPLWRAHFRPISRERDLKPAQQRNRWAHGTRSERMDYALMMCDLFVHTPTAICFSDCNTTSGMLNSSSYDTSDN